MTGQPSELMTMTASQSDPTSPRPPADQGLPDEVRFRFIGFDVYPKHIPRFWKSDAEAAGYAKQVQLGSGVSSLDRDFSLLHDVAIAKTDKLVLTAVGVVMLLTVAMPWVHYRTATGGDFSLSWPGVLGTLLGGMGTAFSGGLTVGVSAFFSLIAAIATPLLGAWILAMLWTKAPSDDAYQVRLRLPLQLSYGVFFAGLAVIILSLAGGQIPGFANWGLIEPGESYGIGTLLTLISYGPYAALGAGMVAGVKSGDL